MGCEFQPTDCATALALSRRCCYVGMLGSSAPSERSGVVSQYEEGT